MIPHAQTWPDTKKKLHDGACRIFRACMGACTSPDFQKGIKHGTALFMGGLLGLILWSMFQKTPTYPVYQFTGSFHKPTPVAMPKPKIKEQKKQKETIPLPQAPTPEKKLSDETKAKEISQEPAPTATNDSLPPARVTLPLPGLTVADPLYGILPVIREKDGLRPFDAYRKTFSAANLNKPLIALIMTDYGLSAQSSKSILDVLPDGVNLALSPSATDGLKWAQSAYDRGHEVWLELAVEPQNYPLNDPGTNALLTTGSVEQNQKALLTQLGRAGGYAGVIVPEPSPYFISGADSDFAGGALFTRGLGLVINMNTSNKILRASAAELKSPFFAGPMITANEPDSYTETLERAERTAREKGFSILVFPPLTSAKTAILGWVDTLNKKGFALAPLSVIAERGKDLSP